MVSIELHFDVSFNLRSEMLLGEDLPNSDLHAKDGVPVQNLWLAVDKNHSFARRSIFKSQL